MPLPHLAQLEIDVRKRLFKAFDDVLYLGAPANSRPLPRAALRGCYCVVMVVETTKDSPSTKPQNLESWKRLKDYISGTPRRIFFKPNGVEAESPTCNSSTCCKRLEGTLVSIRKGVVGVLLDLVFVSSFTTVVALNWQMLIKICWQILPPDKTPDISR